MPSSYEFLTYLSNSYVSLLTIGNSSFLFFIKRERVLNRIFVPRLYFQFQLHVYFPDWIPIDFYTAMYFDERFKEPLVVSAY